VQEQEVLAHSRSGTGSQLYAPALLGNDPNHWKRQSLFPRSLQGGAPVTIHQENFTTLAAAQCGQLIQARVDIFLLTINRNDDGDLRNYGGVEHFSSSAPE
jgi:hypothetical protein